MARSENVASRSSVARGSGDPCCDLHFAEVSAACLLCGQYFDASARPFAAGTRSATGMVPDQISCAVDRLRPRGAKMCRLGKLLAADGGAGTLPDRSALRSMRSLLRVVPPMQNGLHIFLQLGHYVCNCLICRKR